jgi:hypothetical protein
MSVIRLLTTSKSTVEPLTIDSLEDQTDVLVSLEGLQKNSISF